LRSVEAGVDDAHDVRVVDVPGQLRLVEESLRGRAVGEKVLPQQLEREQPTEAALRREPA
jgi:hypothetical protein